MRLPRRIPTHLEMLQGTVEQARQVGDSLRRLQVHIRQTLHEDLELRDRAASRARCAAGPRPSRH